MNPLKNTDKHVSDYLPPALVKDWRQCFRSRSSVALFILLELIGWFMLACNAADSDQTPSAYLRHLENLGTNFYTLGVFALCLIIPFRAGSTVAADTRVRSSNFLMLTPLSARRIVWGTWSSTALMVLLAALCALPLLVVRRMMMGAYPHIWHFELSGVNEQGLAMDCLILFWLVVVGWVMAGFYMFTSVLPRTLRALLLIACGSVALDILNVHALKLMFGMGAEDAAGLIWLPSLSTMLLRVVEAALLLVLFLELTRRHYAAPAENCSRSVRLLAPIPLIIYGVLVATGKLWGWEPIHPESQQKFAQIFLFIALLSDALLPSYAMPAHAWKLWRGLPAWVQKPGFVPSAFCLALGTLIAGLPEILEAWDGQSLNMEASRELCASLNLAATFTLWLLVTDCFCRRSAAKRPLVFGVVVIACYVLSLCLNTPLEWQPVWVAILPLAGGAVYDMPSPESLTTACAGNAAVLTALLLLVLWRGRRKS